MKLDNEDQRNLLLQLIDNVPVQGSVGQVFPFIAKVQDLKNCIAAADTESCVSQGASLAR
jgi:hypothetical protein